MTVTEALRDSAYRAALIGGFANGWANFGVRVALVPLFAAASAGLGAAWGVFLLLGELLIQMPAASHGDAVWDAGGPCDGGVE